MKNNISNFIYLLLCEIQKVIIYFNFNFHE